MARANKRESVKFKSDLISIKGLCKMAGINYFQIYHRRFGLYTSEMKLQVRTKVANALIRDIEPFLNDLGYDVKITPQRSPAEKAVPQR